MNYFLDTWDVIDTFFRTTPYFLTKHHIDSWNDCVSHRILNTIQVLNPFVVLKTQDNGNLTHEIHVYIGGRAGNEVFITKPTYYEQDEQRLLYPNEARLRDLTYQSDIYANIVVEYITREKDGKEKMEEDYFKNVRIGAIPIMLHSKLCILNGQPLDVLKEMGECPYDQGGYFIVDGKEKVIVAQERIALNRIFINRSKDDKYSYEGLIRCTSDENPLFPKTMYIYVNKDAVWEPKRVRTPNAIRLVFPNVQTEVPLFVLFRALGIESDKDILSFIVSDVTSPSAQPLMEFLRHSILDAGDVWTQKDAQRFLQSYVEYQDAEKVQHVLMYDLFPNVGLSFRNKALFLGHVVQKLVKTCLGMVQESDRDNYVFKRVDISGFLFGNLFRDYYNQFRNTVRNIIDREYLYGPWRTSKVVRNLVNKSNLHTIFRSKIIEDGFRKSLKGSWGKSMMEDQVQDADDIKEGVVQDLARISYLGAISHLRRVNTPIDPTSKIVAPHRLHPSQWGIMCPIESPDGASIGLVKHFSVLCNVTFDSDVQEVLSCLWDLGVKKMDYMHLAQLHDHVKVLVNSNWVGIHHDPPTLYRTMKLLKRNGFISIYTSIAWDIIQGEINISTEAGRCCRPLYVVTDGKLLIEKYMPKIQKKELVWKDLISGGLHIQRKGGETPSVYFQTQDYIKLLEEHQAPIEYLDVEETNCSLIAMDGTQLSHASTRRPFTHCEIHPSTILSVVSQNIPLANHNQAPRNIFFGAQGKQAVGTYLTSFNRRIDTMAYVLHYPQKQLVNTRYKEYLHNNVLCGGENLIVAIATYGGYNQEDSIIINRSSMERGMFNMTYFKNIIDKEEENERDHEALRFQNPLKLLEEGQEVNTMKFANYQKTLDAHGFPTLNVHIKENDVILGKTLVQTKFVDDPNAHSLFESKQKTEVFYDRSMIADKTVSGIVDKVFVYLDNDRKKTCKLRLRKIRIPELGDKMASCHGQKGVVGLIMSPEDMPFNAAGVTPDIIINPHALPSRMTIGHLLECVLAKTCVYQGMTVDATPFQPNDYESIYAQLETDFGLERYGNEVLYNGRTGEQIHTEIFFGPTYYQRLKHQVADKINYRTTGPITAITRQPTKGRGNNGGLRIGEMEKDSILAHGMTAFLKESLMERSDIYQFDIENATGDIAISNRVHKTFTPTVPEEKGFSTLKTPYALKLLLQEIRALGIKPVLSTEATLEEEDHYEDYELYDVTEEEDPQAEE